MNQLPAVEPALRDAPQARSLPILGSLPYLTRDPLGFLLSTAIQGGPIVRLNLASRAFYLVSHPEAVKYVLQDNNRNFSKGYDQAKPLLGEGLVTSEGEFWRSQRRLIQPTFKRDQMAHYARFMTEAFDEFTLHWDELAHAGTVFNLAEEMMRLTQTIIVRAMFSSDVRDQADELGAAFDQALEHLNSALFSPSPLLQKLPTPANRRHERALAYLDDFVFTLIEKRRQSGQEHNDLLSRLISAADPETGQKMLDRQIRDEIMTIFLAGHETTANALSWTWYLLGNHPAIEQRLVSEVVDTMGNRPISLENLASLPYSALVFSETLRMFPPAWMFARHAIEEDCIMGIRIPAGVMLFISPYVTHHLPDFWENPEQFNPDRFSEEQSEKQARYAYFPFGGGPRLCIGNHFAEIEARLLMTRFLQRYRIHLDLSREVKPTPIATLQPKPGVFVSLEMR